MVLSALVISVLLAPQDPARPDAPRPTPKQAMVAVEAWIDAKTTEQPVLDRAVEALLASGFDALKALGDRIRSLPENAGRDRARLDAVITHLGIAYMGREVQSGVSYAGQYATLRTLQPWIGDLYVRLLVNTPAWFPDTQRSFLVPALRDLFETESPAGIAGIREIAADEEFESENLRMQLAFALAQWGEGDLAAAIVSRWQKAAQDPDADNRRGALAMLADVHYQMRAYGKGVATYRKYFVAAKAARHVVGPGEYYNAACCAALAKDKETALRWLEMCAAIQGDPDTDPSVKLERKLFGTDPEIDLVRKDPRFRALLTVAFPDGSGDSKAKNGGRR